MTIRKDPCPVCLEQVPATRAAQEAHMREHKQPSPLEELRGHVQAMLKRSDTYKAEAEAEKDFNEGEKHARVSSVLRELDRLAGCVEARIKATQPTAT